MAVALEREVLPRCSCELHHPATRAGQVDRSRARDLLRVLRARRRGLRLLVGAGPAAGAAMVREMTGPSTRTRLGRRADQRQARWRTSTCTGWGPGEHPVTSNGSRRGRSRIAGPSPLEMSRPGWLAAVSTARQYRRCPVGHPAGTGLAGAQVGSGSRASGRRGGDLLHPVGAASRGRRARAPAPSGVITCRSSPPASPVSRRRSGMTDTTASCGPGRPWGRWAGATSLPLVPGTQQAPCTGAARERRPARRPAPSRPRRDARSRGASGRVPWSARRGPGRELASVAAAERPALTFLAGLHR